MRFEFRFYIVAKIFNTKATEMRKQILRKNVFINIILLLVLLFLCNKLNEEYDSAQFKSFVARRITEIINVNNTKQSNLKYILQWTFSNTTPFIYMDQGQEGFIARNCPFTNCIVTSNRSHLKDYSEFDVIVFAGPQVSKSYYDNDLPMTTSSRQKFVFANIESAHYYPICINMFNGYFNWTWTYRLDSEVQWGYITVRDKNNSIIGPNKHMNWMKLEDMDPIDDDFKKLLKKKTRAAAWFTSNCRTLSQRENYVDALQKELLQYKLEIDVYGKCGTLQCSHKNKNFCNKLIKDRYYFYLAFENSFAEDYVTEKLLHALENDAIPIVYGGANYTRFMPEGIYLNARELGVQKLAKVMNDLINDPEKYFEYFKWKKYYRYYPKSASVETNPYCLFCSTLNDEKMVRKKTVYVEFCDWWNTDLC